WSPAWGCRGSATGCPICSARTGGSEMNEAPLLSVRNLSLGVRRKGRPATVIVDDISFDVAEGERFGIVGESGSGKPMTLRAIASLLPAGVKVLSGTIAYRGQDLQTMTAKSRR